MARQFGGAPSGASSDRAKLIILLGVFVIVFVAVLALFLIFSGKGQNPDESKNVKVKTAEDIKMVDVLVPVMEIKPGTPLEPSQFRKESRPQVGISNRVVRDFEEIKGHYARSLIVPGQPLHRDYITAVKPTNALTANIPEGYRAVTIRVDATSSVEGFVRPGAKVDVVWASRIRGRPGVTIIVQNAKVLSAERSTDKDIKPGQPVPNTVTLLVTARDAAKIQLASTTGKLSLQLRGDLDPGKGDESGTITIEELYGGAKASNASRDNTEGTVVIGGKKWLLVDGKLVPAEN